jgi:hypothetical protein
MNLNALLRVGEEFIHVVPWESGNSLPQSTVGFLDRIEDVRGTQFPRSFLSQPESNMQTSAGYFPRGRFITGAETGEGSCVT